MTGPLKRLHDAGLFLPEAPAPLGSYVPVIHAHGLLYLSGMLPLRQGTPIATGRVGEELDLVAGHSAAVVAALNALAVIHEGFGLEAVAGVVRLTVHIACPPAFRRHAVIADGASQVFDIAFAPARHSRLALGAVALPAGAPVELEVVAALR
ncbi:RidA family protein [Nonomuraea sp. NPDC048826]|uniref:RidA family protein n=1 Tax=Nonomuraea sp. NPDC048826 TaxID=3364347 RepID=UPI00371E11B0